MHLFNVSFNDTAAASCRKSCPDSSMVFNTIQAAIESTGVARDDITDSSRTSGRPRTMMIDGCCRSIGNDRAPIAETWRLIPMAPKTNLLISDPIRSDPIRSPNHSKFQNPRTFDTPVLGTKLILRFASYHVRRDLRVCIDVCRRTCRCCRRSGRTKRFTAEDFFVVYRARSDKV